MTQHYVGFFYNKQISTGEQARRRRLGRVHHAQREAGRAASGPALALGSKARWPAQFWFDYRALRTAPHDYRQRLMAGKASFNDPEVVRAFGLWNDLIQRGFQSASQRA